jgi:hypothetical protein
MFIDTPRAGLRALAALGATLAVIATLLPWYAFDVVFATKRITHIFEVPITLWGLTTVAPIVITVASVIALICLTFVTTRVAGVVVGLIGLGIIGYGIYRCVNVPALGVKPVAGTGTAGAATVVESGPIFAMAAGLMLVIGSVGDLLLPDVEPAPDATAAGATGDGVRFQPGQGRRARVR